MDEAELVARLGEVLATRAGGYLRNALRPSVLTCDRCERPVAPTYARCFKCERTYGPSAVAADQVASMIYAVDHRSSGARAQSAYVMYGYKGSPRVGEHTEIVGSLLWIGLSHRHCAGTLLGMPVTHWSTVPSLRGRAGEHELHRLTRLYPHLANMPEACVRPAGDVSEARAFHPTNFVAEPLDGGAHVLLIDDAYVSGGHVESVAASLKLAGAARVSVLCIARWLDPRSDEVTAAFLPDGFDRRVFDPSTCPWTGHRCPQ